MRPPFPAPLSALASGSRFRLDPTVEIKQLLGVLCNMPVLSPRPFVPYSSRGPNPTILVSRLRGEGCSTNVPGLNRVLGDGQSAADVVTKGIRTRTVVPVPSDRISTHPSNSRTRSRIPAIPTPASAFPPRT